jgi:hypothetical protein
MAEDATTYPNLGFNPVPGAPDDVEGLSGKLSTAVNSLTEANGLINRLKNADDSIWQGEAGDAFRSHLDSTLVTDMSHAQTSLEKAVSVLGGWHTDLVNMKSQAAQLDHEAGAAKQAQATAQAAYDEAKQNPAFTLVGKEFDDASSLQQAQNAINSAESAVSDAGNKLQCACDSLATILEKAKNLASQHDDIANKAAGALKDATDKLAPAKPGLLSSMFSDIGKALSAVGDWVKNHLSDIHAVLSTIAAIGGLVALVTPPPIDAIALGVSVAAGAGALACDAADPKFRNAIGGLASGVFKGITTGQWHITGDQISAAMTGVTDVLSVVPGVGVATKLIKGGEGVVEGASVISKISDIASTVAHNPGIPAKLISKIPGVGTALEATKLIDAGSGGITMVTQNMVNILWKGKSVASDLYHDVEKVF